ncbi:hypothetical protein KJ708_06815 [bacterium]|nr:hypothetical protein [bacterium]MBU1917315.1 hypothetical protein [bacterium]
MDLQQVQTADTNSAHSIKDENVTQYKAPENKEPVPTSRVPVVAGVAVTGELMVGGHVAHGEREITESYDGWIENFRPGNASYETRQGKGGLHFQQTLRFTPFLQVGRVRVAGTFGLTAGPGFKETKWNTERMLHDWWDTVPTDAEFYNYTMSYGGELSYQADTLSRLYFRGEAFPFEKYHASYEGIDNWGAHNTVREIDRTDMGEGYGALLGTGVHFSGRDARGQGRRVWGDIDLDIGLRFLIAEDNFGMGLAIGVGGSFNGGIVPQDNLF